MDSRKLINILEKTSEMFLKEQLVFILSGVSERSWYTQFVLHLKNIIEKNKITGYYIDTEYNRNNGKIKTICDNNTLEIIPVTCDIIVHSLGENTYKDNLICIEMKKSTARLKDKQSDKRRLELLTRKSFDNIWSADGKCLPKHVCGYELGVYYEININKRLVHIEYYQDGIKIMERNNKF